jgi:sugar phosphate isomerase/epimerase
VPEAQERWTGLAETLGLKQSGYYGHTPQEVKAILDENGLSSPSMHVDWTTVRTRTEEMAEAAHILGQRYAGIPAIPDEELQTLDAYKRMADAFNEVGARMDALGLRFMYHNHGYGLVEMEGEIPFNVLLERTDPNLVSLQMDVYWTTAGRADPVAYLDAYPGRFRSMHVKDMTEEVRFKGDGGTSDQWIELFPYMTDAGSGVLDLPAILSHARASGVEHFLVERDLAPNPEEALQASYDYLSTVELAG